MKITLKLFATLGQYLPAGAQGNEVELQVEEGITLQAEMERLNLPPALTHLVLVNGVFVPEEARETQSLEEGDELAVWPPIAGG